MAVSSLRLVLPVDPAPPAFAAPQGAPPVVAGLDRATPDARLIDAYGVARCMRDGVLPLARRGHVTDVALADPARLAALRPGIEAALGPIRPLQGDGAAIRRTLVRVRGARMRRLAEAGLPVSASCRRPAPCGAGALAVALGAGLIAAAIAAPTATVAVLTAWAVLAMMLNILLRLMAVGRVMIARRTGSGADTTALTVARRPVVSIMVPLFKERAIAARLVQRLDRLDYPRHLLDICLVVEADDHVTRDALRGLDLPHWLQTVIVPGGTLKTKPRALNYALNFLRGEIIGVYDAEDAPAPDQIDKVVATFEASPKEVACLQGVLDFYNSRRNWLSRCFTVEYASWFRVILPGFARMGLVLPLGGTTFFIRRDVLQAVGGWDAWNVTEDADLGIRLARHGYRTELVDTVTEEEANSWAWPWVKQRSRWLKGYAMTWAVHMRDPVALWRDLGAWRFFGVQVMLLGTLSQFVLAPLIWSFWLMVFGLPHPLAGVLPMPVVHLLWATFILSEAVTVGVGTLAVATRRHGWLVPWVPTLHFYYPLAALAVLRGLAEILYRPFYWDKTEHGVFDVPED